MTQTIAIIDYGSGNLHSIAKAVQRVAGKRKALVTSNARDLRQASHIILPGVGAFGDCRVGLMALSGMMAALEQEVQGNKKPFLGICVGMQLLADKGLEHGAHKGFGWIPGEVKAIKPKDKALKIPHMGWNELILEQTHPVFAGIKTGDHTYFVHSYHLVPKENTCVLATVDYGGKVIAAVAKNNMVGTQFHPEKSQKVGLRVLENFVRM